MPFLNIRNSTIAHWHIRISDITFAFMNGNFDIKNNIPCFYDSETTALLRLINEESNKLKK